LGQRRLPAIDPANIHRVFGENDPETEAVRYGELIANNLNSTGDKPIFDLVMLGMGSDGHTASIFPDQMALMTDPRICAVATHPESHQKRVTLNGPVIAAAQRIAFLITGESKTEKYLGITSGSDESKLWPATPFFLADNATIYMDQAVAGN
jgi:6-phosphogluconolactonase